MASPVKITTTLSASAVHAACESVKSGGGTSCRELLRGHLPSERAALLAVVAQLDKASKEAAHGAHTVSFESEGASLLRCDFPARLAPAPAPPQTDNQEPLPRPLRGNKRAAACSGILQEAEALLGLPLEADDAREPAPAAVAPPVAKSPTPVARTMVRPNSAKQLCSPATSAPLRSSRPPPTRSPHTPARDVATAAEEEGEASSAGGGASARSRKRRL